MNSIFLSSQLLSLTSNDTGFDRIGRHNDSAVLSSFVLVAALAGRHGGRGRLRGEGGNPEKPQASSHSTRKILRVVYTSESAVRFSHFNPETSNRTRLCMRKGIFSAVGSEFV